MARESRTLPITGFAILGAALFGGWFCKRLLAKSDPGIPPVQEVQYAIVAPAIMPQDLYDFDIRVWLADALVDAGEDRLKEIAVSLSGTEDLDDKAWHVLFSCWIEKNPAAAWGFALEDGARREIALEEWATLDPDAARAALESPTPDDLRAIVHGAARNDIKTAFRLLDEAFAAGAKADLDDLNPLQSLGLEFGDLAELARQDPRLALEWAERLKKPELLGQLLYGWHDHSPKEAEAWLTQRPDGDEILSDTANFVSNSAELYRPEMMDLLATSLPAGNHRSEALHQILESLGWGDPDLAVKEANRIFPDADERAEAIGKIASIVTRTDFDKAWDILGALDTSVQGIRRVEMPDIEFLENGRTRKVAAHSSYRWNLTSMRGLVSPAGIKSELLANLIEVDKAEALRAMDRIPLKDFAKVGEAALERWAYRDPEEAATWLAGKMGDQGDLFEVLDMIEDNWLDGEAMRSFLGGLPKGTVRSALALRAAEELAESDPLAALKFARESGTAPELAEKVYAAWSSADPRAAMEHLAGDPDAPPAAWARVTKHALLEAPEEIQTVVENLPDDRAHDAAAAEIIKFTNHSNKPLSAAGWAVAIRDQVERQRALSSVFNRLAGDLRLSRDIVTAETLRGFISTAGEMPEAEKGRWLERIDLEFPPP